MSALKPALGKMLMKWLPTRRARLEVSSNDLQIDQYETPNSTEAPICLVHEYDVLPMAPLIPNLAENYLEPLPQTFGPIPERPVACRGVLGSYSGCTT